jgi:arylsulfatase A-like enzyme/Tfp pilus assembly protein PilF
VRRVFIVAVCLAGLALAIFFARSGSIARFLSAGRPDVLLISIDTLRADRLGSYGYAAAQTPAIDDVAAHGLRFAQAATVTPLTLPAHTSLMTGTFPSFHGVRDNGQFYVSDDLTTLAEVFKANGYRTGGFIGAFVLDRRWGIAQGFDTYFDDFDLSKYQLAAGIDAAQRPGREVVDHALEWLRQSSNRPFFAWVHLYDPHAPYEAPERVAERFPRTMSGAYDAEVAEADIQVARLMAGLREIGTLDRTLVVIVGDHGESLGEHQEQQHGFFVYDATTRIPLIVSGPGIPPRVVPEQVRITDVMPTILDLCRIPLPGAVQGATLAAAARGQRLDLLALSESWYPRYHYGWSELTAVRDGRYKFIAAPRRELYDTQADPEETRDLSAENPRLADALERALQDLSTRMAAGATARPPQEVDPDVEERLRALGYVGGSVSPRALEARPRGDPKDKIELYNLLKQAGSDSVAGRIDDAIAKVHRVLAADSSVVEAYIILGNLHTKAKRSDAAIVAYQKALSLDDGNENAAFALALAYKQDGRIDAAQAGFERVLKMNARNTKAAWQLADIAARRRDFARAEALLTDALDRNVDRPPFLLKLAEAQIERSRYEQAEKNLREALRVKPDLVMAHYDLGLIAEAKNDNGRAVEEYQAEVKNHPTAFQAHFNLAKLMARAGRTSDAVDHFRAAVSANRTFAAGYLYLAKSLLDAGELKESEEAALAGLAANPESDLRPLGHFVLADVYSRMGRTRDAARQVALGRRLERGTD